MEDLADGSIDGIARALAIHIVLSQSLSKGGWSARYVNGGRRDGASYASMVYALRDRIAAVEFERRCALEIIDRARTLKHVLLYLDPPYEGSDLRPYGEYVIDFDALRDLLSQPGTKAKIAISGYGDSYDCLGWEQHERKVESRGQPRLDWCAAKKQKSKRMEVLWINYPAALVTSPLFAETS